MTETSHYIMNLCKLWLSLSLLTNEKQKGTILVLITQYLANRTIFTDSLIQDVSRNNSTDDMFDFLLKTLFKNSIYPRYSREMDQGDGWCTNPGLAQQNPMILYVISFR